MESLLQSLFCDFCSPLTVLFTISFYWRAMLYKRGLRLSVSVCLCVRVSVHLSRSWNLSKRRIVTFLIIAPYKYSYLLTYLLTFKIFSLSGSQASFSTPNGMGAGFECRWSKQKRFWAYIWLHCVLSTLRPRQGVINTAPPDHGPTSCDTYRW